LDHGENLRRSVLRTGAAAALFSLFASATFASAETETWAERLATDAHALHRTYADSHPGAVDPENPAFRRILDTGLARVEERAKAANSYGSYWWALREYVAAFDDGHVFIETTPAAPEVPIRWPGFLTREVNGKHVVAARAERTAIPPMGSQLISCDGIGAEQLAADLIGRFRGRWGMSSQRDAHAWRLFLDADNPYVKLPTRCVFDEGGSQRSYDINWTALSKDEFAKQTDKISMTFRTPTEMRQFGQRGLWVSMGSFSGDASSEQGKAISALVKQLERNRDRLTEAQVLVLDVRGNGGGSSRWGNEIAALIWGKKAADAAKPRSGGVDWRASAANIEAVEAYAKSPGTSFFARMFMARVVAGMKTALATGQPLWREKGAPPPNGPRLPVPTQVPGRKVYILSDGGCASACLDALDVWIRAGAIPIGRETSADSLYMEIRKQELPSGLATISVPMKVYRGRPRGLNVTYKPVHRFAGDIRDQKAVEAWVMALPTS
jgi:hypothetical protein